MKNTPKITAAILSAALLCSSMITALPSVASVYNGLEYENLEDHIMITGCDTTLTSVEIPAEIEGLPVTHIGGNAFNGCTLLSAVSIPDTVTLFGEGAFANCDSLTSIVIPEGTASLPSSLFNGCDSLTEVRIPESVTAINSFAFSECLSLSYIFIPDGVTSIASKAFQNCTALTEMTMPDTLTEIKASAFTGCDALTSVMYFGTAEEWSNITIGESNETLLDATVYYADGTTSSGDIWKPSVSAETTEPDNSLALGDLNEDGAINAKDAALTLRYAAAVGAAYEGTLLDFLTEIGVYTE